MVLFRLFYLVIKHLFIVQNKSCLFSWNKSFDNLSCSLTSNRDLVYFYRALSFTLTYVSSDHSSFNSHQEGRLVAACTTPALWNFQNWAPLLPSGWQGKSLKTEIKLFMGSSFLNCYHSCRFYGHNTKVRPKVK